jgi:hypothetical protein
MLFQREPIRTPIRGAITVKVERELATCHKIIDAHVQALVEKLDSESERLYNLDRVHPSSLASHHIAGQEETTCCVVNVAREFKHTVLPSYTEP